MLNCMNQLLNATFYEERLLNIFFKTKENETKNLKEIYRKHPYSRPDIIPYGCMGNIVAIKILFRKDHH
jgi:hypothetical protein